MPRFSIVCPIYNAEQTLSNSITSILKQSFFDWELILVNDGSVDDSRNICEKAASTNQRIKVLHQKNCGQSKARLNGINAAKGEYILFLDSDDEFASNALQTIDRTLKNSNLKLLVYNASKIQKDKANIPIYNFNGERTGSPVAEFFLKRRISYLWSICFKRELFKLQKNILETFCSLSYSEDLYLIYNIVKKINAEDFQFINEQLYKYNNNENSLTKNHNAKKALDRFYSFDEVYSSIYKEHYNDFLNIDKEVKDTAGWTYISAAKRIAIECDYEAYLSLIKQIRSSFIFRHMNTFKKDRFNFKGYIFLKLKMYKRFRKYIIKNEGEKK